MAAPQDPEIQENPEIRDVYNMLRRTKNQQSLGHLTPEPYHGYSCEDLEIWISRMESYFAIRYMNDPAHRATMAQLLLRGPAEIWCRNAAPNQKDTWDHLTAALRDQFGNLIDRWSLQNQIEQRKLKINEKVEQYINDVRMLASRLNMDDAQTMQALIRGLSPTMKQFVIGHAPANLEQTLQKIRLSETVQTLNPISAQVQSIPQQDMTDLVKQLCQTLAECFNRLEEKLASQDTHPPGITSDAENLQCYNCSTYDTGYYV